MCKKHTVEEGGHHAVAQYELCQRGYEEKKTCLISEPVLWNEKYVEFAAWKKLKAAAVAQKAPYFVYEDEALKGWEKVENGLDVYWKCV